MTLAMRKRHPDDERNVLEILLDEKKKALCIQEEFVQGDSDPRVRSVALKVTA
jgi:hypothetical protein